MMRARILRGAREVGGSCVELECDGARLVIDVGLPLDAAPDSADFPDVAGLRDGDRSIVGVVLSHGHPDHHGLAQHVHSDIPVFMGAGAHRVLAAAALFTSMPQAPPVMGHLADRVPLALGPFRVTPYLMDHSAFDAYALLVEASGQRLFYSGDLRAHGRKSRLFERFLSEPPGDIDELLLEGTNVRDQRADAVGLSEREVEEQLVRILQLADGMVLACYSPQNIDRLVSLYRACRRTGRRLVLDLYAADVARATGLPDTIPQAEWDGVDVFVPQSQRVRVKNAGAFDRIERVRDHRIYPQDLAARAPRSVVTFRASMGRELERAKCLTGAVAVWSMWPGYLERESGTRLIDWFDRMGIPWNSIHSSGHAPVPDLQRFAETVAARQVVPIHTGAPQRFRELFENVRLHRDGDWWSVAQLNQEH